MADIDTKITRRNLVPVLLSSLLLLGALLSFVLHSPANMASNPPYHYYGGFDFAYWWANWVIYGGQLVISLLLWRTRLAHRLFLAAAMVLLGGCILLNTAAFLLALRQPTL